MTENNKRVINKPTFGKVAKTALPDIRNYKPLIINLQSI